VRNNFYGPYVAESSLRCLYAKTWWICKANYVFVYRL